MSTQTTLKEQFIEQFDGREGHPEGDFEIDTDPDNCAVSDDDTIMYCRSTVEQWGIMDFAEYSPNNGWSMGYAEYDDETHTVYVFETGSSWAIAKQLVIKAEKLESVADLLDRTPSDVADDVQIHKTYPAKINIKDNETILIAPVVNAANVQLDD